MTPERQMVDVEGRAVRVSHLEKVMYPSTGTTKAEVMNYLVQVAPGAARPAARPARDPDPVARRRGGREVLREEHARAARPTGSAGRSCGPRPGADDEGAELELPFLDDLAGLVWAANQGALELHTPQWRVGPRGKIHQPDRLVVDLDPGAPAGLDGVRGGRAPRRGPAARGRARRRPCP